MSAAKGCGSQWEDPSCDSLHPSIRCSPNPSPCFVLPASPLFLCRQGAGSAEPKAAFCRHLAMEKCGDVAMGWRGHGAVTDTGRRFGNCCFISPVTTGCYGERDWWGAASRAWTNTALCGATKGCCTHKDAAPIPVTQRDAAPIPVPRKDAELAACPVGVIRSSALLPQQHRARSPHHGHVGGTGAAERRFVVKVAAVGFWLMPFGLLHLLWASLCKPSWQVRLVSSRPWCCP